MMEILFAFLLNSAQRIHLSAKDFCAKHLIARDPWPFAKESSQSLIFLLRETGEEGVANELSFRLSAGMLSGAEAESFLAILREGARNGAGRG
jgi:hypothetical protein